MPNFLHRPRPENFGKLEFKAWELNINRDLVSHRDPTPAEFAAACDTLAHEARHALQWFRMARVNPQGVGDSIDPQALKAAREANQGLRRAERLEPGQLKYQQTQDFYQSVYGTGGADRARIYAEKKVRVVERDVAYDALQQTMNLPINDPTRRRPSSATRRRWPRPTGCTNSTSTSPRRSTPDGTARPSPWRCSSRSARCRRPEPGRANAYGRLRTAEAAALQPRPRDTLEQRKAAREEAFRRYEAASTIVKRLEDKMAAKAPKVP